MSPTDEHAVPRGSGRVLILSTFVLAVAAAAVLILGTQDARLLRLGLVASLWAALLAAFAAARLRRASSSHADRLRAVYQLELEREVTARREHALTVERELREQAELSDRREIMGLRAELAAMRANLQQLLGADPLAGRVMLPAEPARVLPLPAGPRTFDESRSRAPAAAAATVNATHCPTGPELGIGPGHLPPTTWEPASSEISIGHGRHGVPSTQWPGPNGNGSRSHVNGSHTNGAGTRPAPEATPAAQRTVNDLLNAHGRSALRRSSTSHRGDQST